MASKIPDTPAEGNTGSIDTRFETRVGNGGETQQVTTDTASRYYAGSTDLTLKIMTGAALVFTPIVLAYTGYTYWVFRRRIGTHHIPAAHEPVDPTAPRHLAHGR